MKIQLENWKVLNLNFVFRKEERSDDSFDLKTGNFLSEKDEKTFGIGFEIEIKLPSINFVNLSKENE